MDVVLLSRLQFALTIMFHYIFPPLTIGLSVVIVYLKGAHLVTGAGLYDTAARFWTKLFGLNFALGVVTGIVMEFQFGTNWAAYSRFVGDVFGSALAAEGIFAFFLESGFLSLLLFGWDRVGPKTHFFAALMVCLGGIFSSVWITVANSWQQTPAGHEIREYVLNGETYLRAEIVDFWAMVFNPSTVGRLIHVWLGAFILGAAFVMSVSAWYVLRGRHLEFAKHSFHGGLILATASLIAQVMSGHTQAVMVGEHQPAKLAAMEGIFETETGAPLYLFGWPDQQAREVRYGVAVPKGLSLLLHMDPEAEVPGLDRLGPVYGEPPVWITFQAYHIMVTIGGVLLLATLYAWVQHFRGALYETRWLLWFFVASVVLALIANEAGWVSAEVGRQPWIVYPSIVDEVATGGLRTSDGVSECVTADQVLGSIFFFGAIYLALLMLWLSLLHKKITVGPETGHRPGETAQGLTDAATQLIGHRQGLTDSRD